MTPASHPEAGNVAGLSKVLPLLAPISRNHCYPFDQFIYSPGGHACSRAVAILPCDWLIPMGNLKFKKLLFLRFFQKNFLSIITIRNEISILRVRKRKRPKTESCIRFAMDISKIPYIAVSNKPNLWSHLSSPLRIRPTTAMPKKTPIQEIRE